MTSKRPVAPIDVVTVSPSLLTASRDARWDYDLWRTGIEWRTSVCATQYPEALCDPYEGEDERMAASTLTLTATDPFLSYFPLSCEELLAEHATKLADEARSLVQARQAWALSRALWLGEGLAATTTTSGGTAQGALTLRNAAGLAGHDVSVGGAASELDNVFAQLIVSYHEATQGLGGAVLHLPETLLLAAKDANIIWQEGNFWRTVGGVVVSGGPGYPEGASSDGADGYGPATTPGGTTYKGNTLGAVWAYITGPVEYSFGPIDVLPESEAERRGFFRRNSYEIWAQQPGIVRFDPCSTFAALVTSPTGQVS